MNKYKGIFILAIGFAVLFSCSDYFKLDRPPQNPWGNVTEFDRAPVGIYYSIFSQQEWNIAYVNFALVKVSEGDDINWVNDPQWGYTRQSKLTNVYINKGFFQFYRAIAAANDALEFVSKNGGNPYPTETAQNIQYNVNRIIGELYWTRAYSYYWLETMLGHAYVPGGPNSTADIPMPTVLAKDITQAKNPPIGTTQQVWDLILSDLKMAKKLLPETYLAGVMPAEYAWRANRFAASAMLMRTYFQRGQYDSASLEANYIIDQNNGAYDLTEDPIEAFNKTTMVRGKEVIFYVPYNDPTLIVPNHLSVLNQTWSNAECIWSETRMGASTIQRFGWINDPENPTLADTVIQLPAKRDKRFTQLMAVRYPKAGAHKHKSSQSYDSRPQISAFTTIWPYKFYRGPENSTVLSQTGLTNVPLIRLAEIYLTRSICRFLSGDLNGAASDLNVVRARAWNVNVGGAYTPVTPATITEQMISDERLIEMFNEFDRIDYLRALKVPIPKGERGPGTDPYTAEDFVWAIPENELLYDTSLGH
jgi:hypothetical protein